MRDVLQQLMGWWSSGETVGMATVVGTWQSAPRPAGAVMLIGPDASVVGSVSGGCVESDVVAVAEQVINGQAPVLRRYGVSDSDAAAVGLTCGGVVDVFIEAVSATSHPELAEVAEAVAADEPIAVATVVEHPDTARVGRRLVVKPGAHSAPTGPTRIRSSNLGTARIDDAVTDDVRGSLATGRSSLLSYGPDGQRRGTGMRVFATVLAPQPRLLVFGANDFAAAMAKMGHFLGYRVTVCDARPLFATRTRFPGTDELVVDWPHRYLATEAAAGRIDRQTVICVLTHEPKFDVPLLEVALKLDIGYLGAMGSRRTHHDRLQRLKAAGATTDELKRLASPIGLDIGARTPEETAISIAAEIISSRWGGHGQPLSNLHGPIHHLANSTASPTAFRSLPQRA